MSGLESWSCWASNHGQTMAEINAEMISGVLTLNSVLGETDPCKHLICEYGAECKISLDGLKAQCQCKVRWWILHATMNKLGPRSSLTSTRSSLHIKSPVDVLFITSMPQHWPRERTYAQICMCLHWFHGLRPVIWYKFAQLHSRRIVTSA